MPNWCENELVITGSKERLDEIESTGFDFNKIIPMPKEFSSNMDKKNIGGSITRKDGVPIHKYPMTSYDYDFGKLQADCNLEDEDIEYWKSLTDKYGSCGWYEWSWANWGVKWNASSVKVTRVSPTIMSVYFATPWNEPLPILEKLSEGVTIQLRYFIEGNDGGTYTIKNGIATDPRPLENIKNHGTMFIGGPPEKDWELV